MEGKIFAAFCCLMLWSWSQVSGESDTYRAAVTEHYPSLVKDEAIRVASNVEKYKKFMALAKNESADIIVFPEGGLLIKTIHSPVPDPADHIAPCDSPTFDTTEILRNLSCASKENKIYSVVNLLEKRACKKDDKNCPKRGYHVYNTNVGFDRQGTVVARYSKFNLYDEPSISKTEHPEMVYFDTDFNVRFGTFICFDISFPTPALKLIEQYNITDFVYSTYWFSELPFLTALQMQRGWAETNNVNLLASGMNYPLTATFGSGIYNGKFGDLIQIMPETPTSALLIADVPKIKNGKFTDKTKITQKTKIFSKVVNVPLPSSEVSSFKTAYSSSELKNSDVTDATKEAVELLKDHMELFQSEVIQIGKKFNKKICSGDNFCCDFQVDVDFLHSNPQIYVTRAIVFNGVRQFGASFKGGVQCCGVVLCKGPEIYNCTSRITEIPGMFKFKEIQIKGDFRLKDSFQMPSTLTDGDRLEPLSSNKYDFKKIKKGGAVEVSMELNWPVTNLQVFGIWGRDFTRDNKSSGASVNTFVPVLFAALVFLNHIFSNFF